MNKDGCLKCPECGELLTMNEGYTGCDWDCEAGEGSGYSYLISLDCSHCGVKVPLGYVKKVGDFSIIKEKYRAFGKGSI